MAAEGRAVIVSGVPTGIEEKRLTDKLCIHFLRKRHGGGDISSIILPKSTPGSAIITFEESEVAQRVVQYGKHILSVDDKTFELTVSLFCKDVDPDEVFLGVEVMVDYSRLPLGRIAVSCLQKSFPDVHFSFIPKQGLCKLKGRFSEVQALINQLLTLIDPQASAATTSLETTGSTNNLSSRGKTSSVDEPVYHLRCNDRQMESWFAKQASSHDLESLGNSERSDHSNHELDNYQEEKDSTVTRLQETPLEEYFLVMDSDIFKYLQKHCGEYQDILSQNRVEAVDICTQDITTVYLQTGEATVGEGVKHVKRVHQELGRLYQDKEAQLRKEQVLKEGISTEDLQQAFKALQQQLPRIMLSDDEMYIYIVGSGSEVSEAKQFFLDMQKATDESRLGRAGYTSLGHDMDSLFLPSSSASPSDSSGSIFDDGEINMRQKAYKKDIVGSGRDVLEAKQFILDNQWTGSGSRMESGIDTKPLLRPDKAFLFQPPTTTSSAVNMESTDSREMDTVQKSYRKDKMEAGKGYKLAARFMEAGNKTPRDAELGSYLSDTTVPQNTQKDLSCSTSKKISENRHWLGALPASVSGNLGVEYGRYSLKGHQGLSQIGNDMLLRRPCRNTALPSKPVHFTNAQSTMHHLDLFGSKVAQTTEMPSSGLETQSKLRRVHSFSGRVRSKQDSRDSTIPADIHMKTNRARTSSLSNSTADTQEVYNFEIVVPYSVWFYMKDCYSTLLEKITTDVSVKEYKSGSSFTLHLRGTDSTKVDSSQKELQNLIAMVNTDFCQKELPLEKLGMANPKNETLEVSCMELRNKFKKVKILLGANSVFIMGPNQLCEQVVSKLMDIFHNGMDKKEEMKEGLDGPSSEYLFPDNQAPLPETLIDDTKDKQTTSRSQGKTHKARTSSFSDSGVDAQDVYIVEVLVSYFVWLYMKDCYRLQIENLTTDVHVKECKSGSSFSLHLRGTDLERVGVCQKELQNLIAMVKTDFCPLELSLERLGLTNPKDETLEISCMELQNTHKKVKILPGTKSIFILGPNQLCEQVVSKLMDIFHNGKDKQKEMKEGLDGPSSEYLFPDNQAPLPETLIDDTKNKQTTSRSQGKTHKARTSSFSDSGVDAQDVYIVEVLVSYFVWLYMKDCYSIQIENLTTDVHVKECKSESSFSLHLRGADSARVSVCQKELQNLIAMVKTDFCPLELSLERLGLTNPKDETLEISCMELQNTYKKVKILPRTKSIFILGPNQQGEQVVSLLMEVFHNGIERKKMKEGQDGPSSSTYLFPENQDSLPRTLTDYSKDQQTASGSHNLPREDVFQATSHISLDSPQYSGVTQIGEELGPNSRRTDSLQGKVSSQMEKESEIRGEGGSHSAEQKDPFFNLLGMTKSRERTDTSLDQPTETAQTAMSPKDSGSISLPNLAYFTEKAVVQNKENIPKPHNISTDKRPLPPGLEELQNSEGKDPKHQDACGAEQSRDSNDTPEEQRQSCSCGAGRGSISRMACGVAFCQQCLHVHVSCKVCPKGIRGTMSWSEMCMTLPGHIKDMTLKITYTVPDGIQGEDHPSPGSPFQGGVFDAFLPLNKQTKRLLPLLKRAFDEGLTFTVMECHKVARVAWASIPHKTKMSGGKSVNGYPDSGFLRCLTEALKSLSFGEDRDTAKDQDKIKN